MEEGDQPNYRLCSRLAHVHASPPHPTCHVLPMSTTSCTAMSCCNRVFLLLHPGSWLMAKAHARCEGPMLGTDCAICGAGGACGNIRHGSIRQCGHARGCAVQSSCICSQPDG